VYRGPFVDLGFFFEVFFDGLVEFLKLKRLGRIIVGETCGCVIVGLSVKFQLGGDKTGVAK
jgi:hypothetical protein